MKTLLALVVVVCLSSRRAAAQEDLLKLLDEQKPAEREFVYATFKATRLVNGHTVEVTPHRHVDFRISHRFGSLAIGTWGQKDGFRNVANEFFGMDNADIRLGLEYGFLDRYMVGLSRSSYKKTVEGAVKAKLLRQSTGAVRVPITLTAFATMGVQTGRYPDENRKNYFSSRLYYGFQLMAARKFNERLSLQLTPTIVHRNLVATKAEHNTVWAIGFAGRFKVSKRAALTGEYFLLPAKYYSRGATRAVYDRLANSASIGVDLETGGHVFQLFLTNSQAIFEPMFVAETFGKWEKGDIRIGFNIVRVFNLKGGWGKRPSNDGAKSKP
ncbi:MAG: DUF5777 family beta-barrel protein [Bacteroidia bacterium]|nr:DUF5777 family beta-barrel protein [Bacteroidia bacterium]MDW8334251.1 DUF5777 family beta-barrel protein [Bacteroidia bacterium]